MEPADSDLTLTAIGDALPCDTLVRFLDARHDEVPRDSLGGQPACRRLSKGPAVSVDSVGGVMHADTNGTDTVEVSLDGVSVLRAVTVSQVAAKVVVTPTPFRFRSLGEVRTFSGQGMDRRDHVIGSRAPIWKSTDDSVVSIDSLTGLATAKKNGKVILTATMDSAATTDSVEVSQVAVRLVFTRQPDTTVAGELISDSVRVTVWDSLSQRVVTFNRYVTLEIGPNATCATLSGTPKKTADSGVVTFTDLKIRKAGPCTLVAKTDSVPSVTSNAFAVVPGPATSVSVSPSSYQFRSLGQTHQFVVAAADSLGNVIANPVPHWRSTDSTVVFVDKVFGLATARWNGSATVVATVDDCSGSVPVEVSQVARKLAFVVQPHDTSAGATLAPPLKIAVQDSLGNMVGGFVGDIMVRIGTGPSGGRVMGDTIVSVVSGVATFFNLTFNKNGSYELAATSGNLVGAPSRAFEITAGQAKHLAFTVQPSNTPVGSAISPALVVTAQDSFANTATSFGGDVTVAIGTNPSGGILSGATTRAAVAGTDTFPGLAIDKAGDGYTLTASATDLTGATSDAFNVRPSYPLTVTGSGSGGGTVTSVPRGINCAVSNGATGGTCSANFVSDTTVTLTANPTAGHSFTGWSGACTGGALTCTVPMIQAQSVTAAFAAPRYTLTLRGAGTGSGTVISIPSGISCSISAATPNGTCAASFTGGTSVTLTASPGADSYFRGWSGACTGGGLDCTFTITQDTAVTVNFGRRYALSVSGSGLGDGTVTSTPAGISCMVTQGSTSGTCTAQFADTTHVQLDEVTATSYDSFTGWSGACGGTNATCTLNMTQDRNVTASFTHVYYTLSVSGSGSGSVSSNPTGISCSIAAGATSGTCSSSFRGGIAVRLTANDPGNNLFTGWSGDCSGNNLSCDVMMTGPKSVTAGFTILRILTLTLTGSGNGTVTGSSSFGTNFTCTKTGPSNQTCSPGFKDGDYVTLAESHTNTNTFGGWTGCSSSGSTCSVSMTQDQTVTATFTSIAGFYVIFDSLHVNATGESGNGEFYWDFTVSTPATLFVDSVPCSSYKSLPAGATWLVNKMVGFTKPNAAGSLFAIASWVKEDDTLFGSCGAYDNLGNFSQTFQYGVNWPAPGSVTRYSQRLTNGGPDVTLWWTVWRYQ